MIDSLQHSFSRWVANFKSSPADLPAIPRNKARSDWVDVSKGISISLVVLWHFVQDHVAINEAFIFLRMPLFFFVAGIFIRSSFRHGGEDRFFEKVINFSWLYFLWSYIIFFSTKVPANILDNSNIFDGLHSPVEILHQPPFTIWFIYALCLAVIVTMILRKLPIWLLISVAVMGYLWSASDGVFRNVPFFLRFLRLYPFFLLGLISFEMLSYAAPRFRKAGPFFLLAFLVLAYHVYFSSLVEQPYVTFAVSMFGLISVFSTARLIEETDAGNLLKWIGERSLYVYLIHGIFLVYFLFPLHRVVGDLRDGSPLNNSILIAAALLAIVFCAWFGAWISRIRPFNLLFAAPPQLQRRAASLAGR